MIIVATGLAFADIGPNGAALLPYLMLVGLIWAGMRFGTRCGGRRRFRRRARGERRHVARARARSPPARLRRCITLQIFLAIALITSFVVAAMASDLADRDEVHRPAHPTRRPTTR